MSGDATARSRTAGLGLFDGMDMGMSGELSVAVDDGGVEVSSSGLDECESVEWEEGVVATPSSAGSSRMIDGGSGRAITSKVRHGSGV